MNLVSDLVLQRLKKVFQNVKLVDSGRIPSAGIRAHWIIVSGNSSNYDLQWMQVFINKNDRIYVVTYTSEQKSFQQYLPTMQRMVKSFEVL